MNKLIKTSIFGIMLILASIAGSYTANFVTQTVEASTAYAGCEDDLCAVDTCRGLKRAKGYKCDMTGSDDCTTDECGSTNISFY